MSVYVIAEAGVNHNGDIALAHRLIDAAADAGADAVKFQTFVPELLASRFAAKADYQQRNQPDDDGQLQMLQRLALGFEQHHELVDHCAERGIAFLSSPFDPASAAFLIDTLQLPCIKLGSGELTNGPLLWQLARSGRELILSTGMADMQEIQAALGLICHAQQVGGNRPATDDFATRFEPTLLRDRVTLLHCTTEYPCPLEDVNLRAMDSLRQGFGLAVGYSDHTEGISVALAAAARGAQVIEKHFTLDRDLPGPDHRASLQPPQLQAMVQGIRDIERALGSNEKRPAGVERRNAQVARKSLCASRAIAAGEVFSVDNLCAKRPGNGISPMLYWQLLGRTAATAYGVDEPIREAELDNP